MKTLIFNAHILCMDSSYREFKKGYLEIIGKRIGRMGNMDQAPEDIAAVIGSGNFEGKIKDARGGILLPGMINGHTHGAMIPFRSLGDDAKDRLRRFLFPLEENMNEALVRAGVRYGMAEMLLAGITAFADMYYFEPAIAREAGEFGMRAILGETIIGQKTCEWPYLEKRQEKAGEAFARKIGSFYEEKKQMLAAHSGFLMMEELIAACGKDRVMPMIAPHAPNTNSREALQAADAYSRKADIPIMMHISEMEYKMEYFRREYGMTPIEFLDDAGLLSHRLLAVHCIHLTDKDISLLKEKDVAVIHCIGANLKSAKGIMPLKKLLDAGVRVGIGTDGPGSGNTLELFSLLRTMAYVHKTVNRDRGIFTAKELVSLATSRGAQALGLKEVGVLQEGYLADLCLIETDSVNMFPLFDPYSAIVYSANASNVDSVWVDGAMLVEGKKLVHWNLGSLRKVLEGEMGTFSKRAMELEKALMRENCPR